jgi:orotidine-5'-phosphate decarboxylase
MRNFSQLASKQYEKGNLLCVGLDTDIERIPQIILKQSDIDDPVSHPQYLFNKAIIDATSEFAGAYKPNMAFYLKSGWRGIRALEMTIEYIKQVAPEVPVILDAKMGDIGNTSQQYADAAFKTMGADAVTDHNYTGYEGLKPFFEDPTKFVFVLCRNSNPGAAELQDILVKDGNEPIWSVYAKKFAASWNVNGNCGVVAGATGPEELAQIRKIVGSMPILAPGIGAQGGDLAATVKAGVDDNMGSLLINSSRGIIFASDGDDFAEAAAEAASQTNMQIKRVLEQL